MKITVEADASPSSETQRPECIVTLDGKEIARQMFPTPETITKTALLHALMNALDRELKRPHLFPENVRAISEAIDAVSRMPMLRAEESQASEPNARLDAGIREVLHRITTKSDE